MTTYKIPILYLCTCVDLHMHTHAHTQTHIHTLTHPQSTMHVNTHFTMTTHKPQTLPQGPIVHIYTCIMQLTRNMIHACTHIPQVWTKLHKLFKNSLSWSSQLWLDSLLWSTPSIRTPLSIHAHYKHFFQWFVPFVGPWLWKIKFFRIMMAFSKSTLQKRINYL